MVQHKHTAEMCPVGNARPDKEFITRLEEQIRQADVKFVESYTDGPGHEFYLLIDTDDVAKLYAAVKELFVGENRIVPVLKFSDTVALTRKLGVQK